MEERGEVVKISATLTGHDKSQTTYNFFFSQAPYFLLGKYIGRPSLDQKKNRDSLKISDVFASSFQKSRT